MCQSGIAISMAACTSLLKVICHHYGNIPQSWDKSIKSVSLSKCYLEHQQWLGEEICTNVQRVQKNHSYFG